jgi:SAM-dependent MidA family methyltransferase
MACSHTTKAPLTNIPSLIKTYIAKNGPVDVATFMHLCLHHEDYGYYHHQNPIGASQDFITAPELTNLFGMTIGFWFVSIWTQLKETGHPIHLIELGPGRGTLMHDILSVVPDSLHERLNVHMVDINPILSKVQQDTLKPYETVSTKWHQTIDQAILDTRDGYVFFIANEFFDALPVHQFISDKNERHVCCKDGKLAWDTDKSVVREKCPQAQDIMLKISRSISLQHGAALIIDYGYITHAGGDSLQAVRQHKFEDVFACPGLADLTAHVNFQDLANMAEKAAINVHEITTQGSFLSRLGLSLLLYKMQRDAGEREANAMEAAVQRLISKEQMGHLFKVMAVSDLPSDIKIEGFVH